MSTPQILTDEQAAAIWLGDTASILNYDATPSPTNQVDPVVTSSEPVIDVQTQAQPANPSAPTFVKPIDDKEIDQIWTGEETEDDDTTPVDPATVATPAGQQSAQNTDPVDPEPKRGRKPADLVNLVNQLVQDDVLVGFEEGEVKTIEEARELITENLKYKETNASEDLWKKKVESYSPQIQAILHYAEKGGQDVTPLLTAIAEVEKSSDLDAETSDGQEEIVRQMLKVKGFDDEEIKDQIETLKDLDKLKTKAEKFLPELNKTKQQRIELMMQEQEHRDQQAREAARIYVETIQGVLDKDDVGSVKLKREDKFKIMEALAVPKFRSLNGYQVNEFVKTLEDLQFGKNSNYEHFLNIVQFAIDKEGFISKLKDGIKNEVTTDTVRRLKTAKTSSANTAQDNSPTEPGKKVIQKAGFRNPYSK